MAEVRMPEIRTIRSQLGLSQELFSRMLDVSTRNVERWEGRGPTGRMDAGTARRLAIASEIMALATEVYGSEVNRFMVTPRRSLAMRTPREAMIHGDLELVRQLLINELQGHWA
jgi:uncharacterized protein (DUF2384 family)